MSTLLQRLQNHFAEAWYYFRNPNIPSSGPDRNVEGLVYRDGDDFEAILHSLYSDSVLHSGADATIVNLALQALKDHEYIRDSALKGAANDPFIVSTDALFERVLLRQCLEKIATDSGTPNTWSRELTADLSNIRAHPQPDRSTRWKVFGRSRTMQNRQDAIKRFMQRLLMAVVGGVFLVGPMHIMVLHPGRLTGLVTTSVSVLLFGVVVAAVLERMFDVLSVTAAYTAVLVVFVGTSMGAGSLG
ncbi:hypothetical protein DL95DRAFT_503865 [Leptodontidium sp. 2 PMI_412]|nr:hypothetical protein DL95DRAFT_503865 [Leptodontidium sp. 2 PMI_412]